MMGTYPLLQSQYTTAKREIQGVFNKISNNSACIKKAASHSSEKFEIQRPRRAAADHDGGSGGGRTNRKA